MPTTKADIVLATQFIGISNKIGFKWKKFIFHFVQIKMFRGYSFVPFVLLYDKTVFSVISMVTQMTVTKPNSLANKTITQPLHFTLSKTYISEHLDQGSCQRSIFLLMEESCCQALISYASRTTNPMDVFLNVVGKVIVDHMLHIRDVQSTGSHRCGYQHRSQPRPKISQRFLSLSLETVSLKKKEKRKKKGRIQ